MLLLFLVNSSSAETFIPYTPDSLKKSDWMEIESVHYYPYVAPGIEEKVPWRAEYNIRRFADIYDPDMHSLAPITPDQVKKHFKPVIPFFKLH